MANTLKHSLIKNINESLDWPNIQFLIRKNSIFPLNFDNSFKELKDSESVDESFNAINELVELATEGLDSFFNELRGHHFINDDCIKEYPLLKKNKFFELLRLYQLLKPLDLFLIYLKNSKSPQFLSLEEEKLRSLAKLCHYFFKFIDEEGNINYNVDPEINKLFQKINGLEVSIRKTLNDISNDQYAQALQYQGHDKLNENYVLPIKSDSYNKSMGDIIAHSETHNTLYVIPTEIEQQNYTRKQLVLLLDEKIYKFTLKIINELSNNFDTIDYFYQVLLKLDLHYSKSCYVRQAHLVRPEISENKIILEKCFHPLIEEPVRNSLSLDKNLVISGPNTGGKTVILKVIALCAQMVRYGMYVPASYAEIPLFSKVFFLANDNQDLSMGLSSFSSEVEQMNELFNHFDKDTLLVIDEVFNSTSSDEASALTVGLINIIKTQWNFKILLSTHHELLKKLLHKDQDFISSHMGFDESTNSPTYKLHLGSPGSSMAFPIFEKIFKHEAHSKTITSIAKANLDQEKINYEELLQELNNKKQQLFNEEQKLQDQQQKLANKEKSFEAEVNLKRLTIVNDAKKESQRIIAKAQALLDKSKAYDFQSKNEAYKQLAKAKKDTTIDKAQSPKIERTPATNPQVGSTYFCELVNKDVKLKSIKGASCTVTQGMLTIKCKLSDLYLTKSTSKLTNKLPPTFTTAKDYKINYDGRGMRLDEFKLLVEEAIQGVLLEEVPFVSIIHGHGTGVLKNWLREYIKNKEYLSWEIGSEGNDGETKIKLS